MSGSRRRRGIDGDDSLLASVAGVPLTRMARIAVCGFWAARILLTDAIAHVSPLDAKLLSAELLGPEQVDQAFTICMIWLTVEVAVSAWSALKSGGRMLIAKTTPSFKKQLIKALTEDMTLEDLEALVEKKRKARQEKVARKNGKEN